MVVVDRFHLALSWLVLFGLAFRTWPSVSLFTTSFRPFCRIRTRTRSLSLSSHLHHNSFLLQSLHLLAKDAAPWLQEE